MTVTGMTKILRFLIVPLWLFLGLRSYCQSHFSGTLSLSIEKEFPVSKSCFTNLDIDSPYTFSVYPKHSLRNEYSSFWKKAGRGELIIGGIELIGMGGLILMPKEVTKWQSGWIKAAERNIVHGFSSLPVWDHDNWQFNYVGHPIAGSYYYNSVRSQNAKWWQSFLFAATQSCIWEYIIEGSAEQPSIQDLIVTPVGGTILGESVNMITMQMRKNGFRFLEKVFVLVFNPMFVLNNGFGPKHNPVRINRF
jgi:uncharacterized protein DUF3943